MPQAQAIEQINTEQRPQASLQTRTEQAATRSQGIEGDISSTQSTAESAEQTAGQALAQAENTKAEKAAHTQLEKAVVPRLARLHLPTTGYLNLLKNKAPMCASRESVVYFVDCIDQVPADGLKFSGCLTGRQPSACKASPLAPLIPKMPAYAGIFAWHFGIDYRFRHAFSLRSALPADPDEQSNNSPHPGPQPLLPQT
ncbi:hypothetical protein AAA535_05865 [Pseudomonas aeruginosa]